LQRIWLQVIRNCRGVNFDLVAHFVIMSSLSLISTLCRRLARRGVVNIGPNKINSCISAGSSSHFQSHHQQSFHTTSRSLDTFKIQDEDDFNAKVLKNRKPVVVQFHATWCGPCKMLSPRMEKTIAATKDAVDLAHIDIDENPDIAMSYSVGAVPAVMAIKDGKVVDKFIGLKDEDELDTFVAKLNK